MAELGKVLDGLAVDELQAAADFVPSVYKELRKLAAKKLSDEKSGQTLQPTALVHEVYLRLLARSQAGSGEAPRWNSSGHFFAAAAEAMRRILVETARRKKRVRHGGDLRRVPLGEQNASPQPLPDDVIALDEALTLLAEDDPAAAQVVHLHFFAGLSMQEVADTLGMSRATTYRQWAYARAWLGCAVGGGRR
jgi:RNA polymerase sigma factor (TIGR02999 family)